MYNFLIHSISTDGSHGSGQQIKINKLGEGWHTSHSDKYFFQIAVWDNKIKQYGEND